MYSLYLSGPNTGQPPHTQSVETKTTGQSIILPVNQIAAGNRRRNLSLREFNNLQPVRDLMADNSALKIIPIVASGLQDV